MFPLYVTELVDERGACRWVEHEITAESSKTTKLAELDAPCGRAKLQLSADGQRALIATDFEGDGVKPRVFLVDVARGKVTPLPPLPTGVRPTDLAFEGDIPRVRSVGFGAPEGGEPHQPVAIVYDGVRYDTASVEDGIPQLTAWHAWKDGKWQGTELRLMGTGFSGAESEWFSEPAFAGPVEPVEATPPETAALTALGIAPEADGEWQIARSVPGAVAQFYQYGEGAFATAAIAIDVAGKWTSIVASDTTPVLRQRGRWLLVDDPHSVTSPPRIYDLKTGGVVWTGPAGDMTRWSPLDH